MSAGVMRGALAAVIGLALAGSPRVAAGTADQPARFLPDDARVAGYVGRDVMIPMRDGTRLHAEIWRPAARTGNLPILLQRSPYSFRMDRITRLFGGEFKELAADGYTFLLEDIRGRFGSGGSYAMFRPQAAGEHGVDESTDAFDTIDWAVRSIPGNNGRAGVFGVSYLGWTSAMAAIDPHPALRAISVQASPEDMYMGDDFHHNGAFRLDYAWEYTASYERDERTTRFFDFGRDDPYDWYLRQPSLGELDRRVVGRDLPTWRDFVAHPDDDAHWQQAVTSARMPARPAIPDLIVAGWWDQEDFYGPLTIYARQRAHDTDGRDYLVVGPWNHGGWTAPGTDHIGPFDLGADTAAYFRARIEAPWFAAWLKGGPGPDLARATVFETGSNRWRTYDAWPPANGVSRRRLYLHAHGMLSFDGPAAPDAEPDRFVSDPADPVPYRVRPISPSQGPHSTWSTWLLDDQSPFARRADVRAWQTAALDHDLTVRGQCMAHLFASTTGSDADWVVKLIDVYPDDASTPAPLRGRQLIVADEVFRGRYRSGFEHPRAIAPNHVLDYAIDLHTASHVFAKGHRVAIQVQSSWFPLIDRNPQVFVPNMFLAAPSDFHAQTHAVFHSPAYPSGIEMDVAAGQP